MNKIIIVIIISLCSHFSFSQKYSVLDTVKYQYYYNYEFQVDSTSAYSRKSQECVLRVGSSRSVFASTFNLYTDSILFANRNEPMNVTIGKLNIYLQGTLQDFYGMFRIYKNYPEHEKTTFKNYSTGKFYRVVENNNFKWEIIPGIDSTLLGFKCKQAKTYFAGRNYVAWFTLDIPISDGPYKFKGLPGLIVAISDTKNQHCFELTRVVNEKNSNPIIIGNSKYTDVTAKEFTKILEAEMAILYNKVSQQDGIILNSDEAKARSMNRLKSRNNFIEKY